MGPQAVVRDVGCFLLMNFVICKKMYNIYIYRYILYIFCLLKWQVNDVNLCFFWGGACSTVTGIHATKPVTGHSCHRYVPSDFELMGTGDSACRGDFWYDAWLKEKEF